MEAVLHETVHEHKLVRGGAARSLLDPSTTRCII